MRIYYIVLLLLLMPFCAIGQNYSIDQQTTIEDCSGYFTDSGGETQAYANNENFVTTICGTPENNAHLRLHFVEFNLGTGDQLNFYDGLTTDAAFLASKKSADNDQPFAIQATAANLSGCLTIAFSSDTDGVGKGWAANIACIAACQLIQAEIVHITPTIPNEELNALNVCLNTSIAFEGKGNYLQNNLLYPQNDAASVFEWNFGDGTTARGTSVSHTYQNGGGYWVTLTIKDQFGCTNGNIATQLITVAPKPQLNIAPNLIPNELCLGNKVTLSSSLETNAGITVRPQTGTIRQNFVTVDSVALPEGNVPPLISSIQLSGFRASQVLTNIADLQAICINLEHSWLHDLDIYLTCPNGNTVYLQRYQAGQEKAVLGKPVENDFGVAIAGQGSDYCWSPQSTNGTLHEFVAANRQNASNGIYTVPATDFNSLENLEGLLGCPFNGDWTLTIADYWEQDNGWLFSWHLDFNPEVSPLPTTFEVPITDIQWQNNPDFISNSNGTIEVQPSNEGLKNYVLTTTDAYNCTIDTSIQIVVLPTNHPDCQACEPHLLETATASICKGENIALANFIDPAVIGIQTFETKPNYEFSNATHPPNNAYESTLEVSDIPDKEINREGSNLVAVCLDLTSDYNSDIDLSLISPNGIFLDLSSDNGGTNEGYLGVCFTLDADQSITESTTSFFAGNYQPEEPFSKLAGTDINGTWTLQISDDGGGDVDKNILQSWSISFVAPESDYQFSWQPSTGLSCTDCYNPTIRVEETTTFIIEKTAPNCQVFDTLIVQVFPSEGPLKLKENSLPNGQLLVNWDAVPDAISYEVSRNQVDWLPANGDFYHIFDGLANNETITVFVRAQFKEVDCPTDATNATLTYLFCDLTATIANQQLSTSCADIADAFIGINATGGTLPYTYILNDSINSSNNQFDGLSAGEYTVFVEDVTQTCADTLTFSVSKPAPLSLEFERKAVTCFGRNDGALKVLSTGGVGNHRVAQWLGDDRLGMELTDLKAGAYGVVVVDDNNCSVFDTVSVIEPTDLHVPPTHNPISCHGANDGEASLKVRGGIPPYNYLWSNGATTNSVSNLRPGPHEVVVTDNNGCRKPGFIIVTEPRAIEVDFIEKSVSCAGRADGQLEAIPSGGVFPYQHNWSNNQTNKIIFNLASTNYELTITDSRGCENKFTKTVNSTTPLQLSTNSSPAACLQSSTGRAVVNVEGGQAPYTYLWNDADKQQTMTASNLFPADYQVLITDALGCQDSMLVEVAAANSVNYTKTTKPVSCADMQDGTAGLIVGGNSDSYRYIWDTGDQTATINQLAAGAYFVTIDNGRGCFIKDSVEIERPSALVIDSIGQIPPACFQGQTGQLTAFISGGAAPYIFDWSNGQTTTTSLENISAGQYALTVTDANDCTLADININLSEPTAIRISDSQFSPSSCQNDNNGQIEISVAGGVGNYQFNWSNGTTTQNIMNIPSGNYWVQITDENNCELVDSFELVAPDALAGQIEVDSVSCEGGRDGAINLQAIGGKAPYLYSQDGNQFNKFDSFNQLSTGDYTVYIKDANNCIWESEIIDVAEPAAFTVNIKNEENGVALGDIAKLTAIPSNGSMIQYEWTNNQEIQMDCEDVACTNIRIQPTTGTRFTVVATNEKGCQTEGEFFLPVDNTQKVFVPNIFSPNGDGQNDYLAVFGKNNTTIHQFSIYDRWGTNIYTTQNLTINSANQGWDGTFKGTEMSSGVYIWFLEISFLDNQKATFSGSINLIR